MRTPRNTPISRSTPGRTSWSTFRGFPVSTSVPGQGDCKSFSRKRSSRSLKFLRTLESRENTQNRLVFPHSGVSNISGMFRNKKTPKGRQRQLLPSSLGPLSATSEVPVPLSQIQAPQHKRHRDVSSDVCLRCSCCPWAGAEIGGGQTCNN